MTEDITGIASLIAFGADIVKCSNLDQSIKDKILKMVKETFEPEAEIVSSYKMRSDNGTVVLDVEYVVFACDSHTCVDFNEKCVIPLKWFDDGFDYKEAYRQTVISGLRSKIKDIETKETETAEEIACLRDELTDLGKQREELLAKIESFKPQNAAGTTEDAL